MIAIGITILSAAFIKFASEHKAMVFDVLGSIMKKFITHFVQYSHKTNLIFFNHIKQPTIRDLELKVQADQISFFKSKERKKCIIIIVIGKCFHI